MSDRSAEKKQHIIKCAREVFAQKGFLAVTMKDIVEACEISRGGLYLYYDNTAALFLDVLKYDEEDAEKDSEDISGDMTSAELLAVFFKEQKKLILRKKNRLWRAIYEYCFDQKDAPGENFIQKQFDGGVRIIETLIAGGVADGDFVCEDPAAKARGMMYVLEGMRLLSTASAISPKEVDREILSMMQEIVVD